MTIPPEVEGTLPSAPVLLADAYGALSELLEAGEHDRDCAFRCLRPGCRDDHHCYVCETWAEEGAEP